jgi:multiple sugar transport system ATP-binding protein
LYVTHDQRESLALASHVAVLVAGKIRQFAPALEIYRRAADRFVAGFFGWPPMQFLDGRLEADGEGLQFVGGGLRLRLSDSQSHDLARVNGEAIQIGLRPDAVSASNGYGDFTAIVRSSEVVGDRVYQRLELPGGGKLMAADRLDIPALDGVRQFSAAIERAQFFAPGEFGPRLA